MTRIVVILSSLLLAAIALMWLRSYRFAEAIEFLRQDSSFLITTHPGKVSLQYPSLVLDTDPTKSWTLTPTSVARDDVVAAGNMSEPEAVRRPRILSDTSTIAGVSVRSIEFPFRILIILPALAPAAAILFGLRRALRRRRRNRCRECGYDLRATPTRCPECGTSTTRRSLLRSAIGPIALFTIVAAAVLGVWRMRAIDVRSPSYLRVDSATLGGFTINQDSGALDDVPVPLRQFDGQRIEIDGYMIPIDQAENITQFALVPTLATGSFPPPILVQKIVVVNCPRGKAVQYCSDLVRVQGTLHVRAVHDDGYLLSIYEVTPSSVKQVQAKASH